MRGCSLKFNLMSSLIVRLNFCIDHSRVGADLVSRPTGSASQANRPILAWDQQCLEEERCKFGRGDSYRLGSLASVNVLPVIRRKHF